MEDIRLLFTYSCEGIMMAYVGLALLGYKLTPKSALIVGSTYGLAIYLVRSGYKVLEIPFGTHTIILLSIMVLLMHFLGKAPWGLSIIATLLGFVFLILGETYLTQPYLTMIGAPSIDEALDSVWLHTLYGATIGIPLMILAVLCYFKDFKLINIELPKK